MRGLLIRSGFRFDDPDDERRFVSRFALDDLGRTQAAMLLGAFVYCAFAVWDWVLDPGAWRLTLAIRVAVAVLVLLPAAASLSHAAVRDRAESVYLVYCVVPGCMLSVIYLCLGQGFEHASAGMIIVILFVSTLLPLRILSLATFCATTWIAFVICETLAKHERPGLRLVNNFEIGISYALSLYAVAAREYRARRQFRTAQALRSEKERSEAALADLRAAQAHLVQSEKLAALGQLVAGVAHEINTPIGLALTTSTALEGDLKQLRGTIETGEVRRSQLTRGLDRLSEGTALVFSSLTRAADLVHNFKQVAVDQATEDRRSFDLRAWLLELMSTLEPLLRRRGHEVRIACPDGILLDSHPGALAQIVSNLALNAVNHAFPDGRTGRIAIDVSRVDGDALAIVFRDDGIGIPPANLQRIFDPFFTTGRDKGSTGLGLHIVYNLVVSTLRGQIAVESAPEAGTRVTITLPPTLG